MTPNSERYLAGRNEGLKSDIARTKTALKEGIPNPRTRASEVERLEALTREAEQLELRIQEAGRR